MIPSLAIDLGTALVFFVGFGVGWWWRGRRDRESATELLEELRKSGR